MAVGSARLQRRLLAGVAVVTLLTAFAIGYGRGFENKVPSKIPDNRQNATPVNTYYVSRLGSNRDGRSWATAWNELDQIKWSVIQPGDTILLDGGAQRMTYNSTLTVGQSGTITKPITIRVDSAQGHNGQVVIFGGRSAALPFCGQQAYRYQTVGVMDRGINIGNYHWVTIDGGNWRGISIHGNNRYGIGLDDQSSHIVIRNVEIYDNGMAMFDSSTSTWQPDLPGVSLSGSENTIERAIIHDNGQDALQSGGGLANFSIRRSWLYNGRPYPGRSDLSFNYCRHSDAIQVFSGGVQSGVLIEDSVIGPGLLSGTILGQTASSGSQGAQVDNVTVRNTLLLNITGANIMGYPGIKSRNWSLQNLTSFMVQFNPSGNPHSAIYLEGQGHTITDSIVYGGQIYMPDGNVQASGNFQFNTSGLNIGTTADPGFVNAPAYTSSPDLQTLIAGDYSLQPGSPASGKGSTITSVSQLLGQPVVTAAATATAMGTTTPSPAGTFTAQVLNTPAGTAITWTATPVPLTPTTTAAPSRVAPTGTPIQPTTTPTSSAVPPSATRISPDVAGSATNTTSPTVIVGATSSPTFLPAPTSAPLFMDDFESGTLSAWTTVNGLVTQQQVVYAGSYAARATSAGQVAYARKHLSGGQNDLYISLWIDSLSQGTSWVYPLRLQTTSGSQLLGIYISGGSSSGTLGYYNNVTNTSTNGGVAISRGAWHSIELHVQINGTTSRIEAWLDGTPVPALTGTTALGTVPIGWVQIGDSVSGASYDVAFDNCTINTRFITP